MAVRRSARYRLTQVGTFLLSVFPIMLIRLDISLSNDFSAANLLIVEAVKHLQDADLEPSAHGKFQTF